MLGLHYIFATNFLVSLFDEKLSRREIDLTNFVCQEARTPAPQGGTGRPLAEVGKNGQGSSGSSASNAHPLRPQRSLTPCFFGPRIAVRLPKASFHRDMPYPNAKVNLCRGDVCCAKSTVSKSFAILAAIIDARIGSYRIRYGICVSSRRFVSSNNSRSGARTSMISSIRK